jgi:hypothetical protein
MEAAYHGPAVCYTSAMGKPARGRGAARASGEGGEGGEIDLAAELAKLDPEQAQMFAAALELAMRKRRIMLLGLLLSIVVVGFGEFGALLFWVAREPGTFVGWVFLVPLAVAGVILVATGKLARRARPRP